MNKNKLTKIIIFIVVIALAFSVYRYIRISPVFIIILIWIIIRSRKNRETNNDRDEQKEEQKEEQKAAYTEESKTQGTGSFQSGAQYSDSKRSDPESTVIICEYCGCRVDTSKHACCDHCGGSYGDNPEWKKIRNRR